jgi:predicted AlkP superfamily phosphohydrolase/phosphomutase/tetratricopeptide (TPR) repeat protein
MTKRRVLLIGWDAADWKVINPLVASGQMPNLARLLAGGVYGNLATLYPALSPMLWTSIATGKRAYKHGIHGFSEPLPDASGIRPMTLLSRKTKAVWNILNQTGHRSIVAGWWPSHPAEPLNGAMVSNFFTQFPAKPGPLPPLAGGTVHPAKLGPSLAELRVNPTELTGDFLQLFVPEFKKVDQAKDKRLHSLAKIIAETMSVHAAATELLETQPWDFAAIYYSGIDHFGHAFMSYHPPRLPWVPEADFAIYQHVIGNAYRYHDAMLGTLLGFTDENTTVIVMSDHGFHPDHSRPGYIPAEPAGPAVEHRHYGIVCMKGPGLRSNEQLYGAGLLDICPTILALFGLPPGKDMDGKVLVTAFKEPARVEPIPSWDDVPGEAGTHSTETRIDPAASAAAFQQLVELGYVAPPGKNVQESVEECVSELKYNLARAYRDGNRAAEAAELAEGLWEERPKEHRFGILLIECLAELGAVERRRVAIDELDRRIRRYQVEAREELAKREKDKASPPADSKPTRAQFELRQLRELAFGRPVLVEWFRVTQALLEKRPEEARRELEALRQAEGANEWIGQRLATALAQLGDLEPARELLEGALKADPENAQVHAQLAGIHFEAARFAECIESATESLSLLYFQPGLHGLLGKALLKTGRYEESEKELLVAVAQGPRYIGAHELLGQLYREHLGRPSNAFAHEGRARSLRNELQKQNGERRPADRELSPERSNKVDLRERSKPFGPEVGPNKVITIVSGLPRSGTSMMMQLLKAGGMEVLTDGKRSADDDNPLGYFEFEKALELRKDQSWVPQARGKVVKLVAQLLPSLPANEHYQIIFMERDVDEVIASQNAMLERLGRRGNPGQLGETYMAQLRRVGEHLARRSEFRVVPVNYAELLSDPVSGVERIASFLGAAFDREAAIAAVRPELRRQGGEKSKGEHRTSNVQHPTSKS